MLITHWGLSGPVILRLSAWGARDLFISGYKGTIKFYFDSVCLYLSSSLFPLIILIAFVCRHAYGGFYA